VDVELLGDGVDVAVFVVDVAADVFAGVFVHDRRVFRLLAGAFIDDNRWLWVGADDARSAVLAPVGETFGERFNRNPGLLSVEVGVDERAA
jgi:hypothetical protein